MNRGEGRTVSSKVSVTYSLLICNRIARYIENCGHTSHPIKTYFLCGPPAPEASLLMDLSSGGSSWTQEQTLVALEACQDVILHFERRGFRLEGMKMLQVWEGPQCGLHLKSPDRTP